MGGSVSDGVDKHAELGVSEGELVVLVDEVEEADMKQPQRNISVTSGEVLRIRTQEEKNKGDTFVKFGKLIHACCFHADELLAGEDHELAIFDDEQFHVLDTAGEFDPDEQDEAGSNTGENLRGFPFFVVQEVFSV